VKEGYKNVLRTVKAT